ncbi:MAG: hypothetical protein WCF45_01185, partial [Photobacterium halotolerans]
MNQQSGRSLISMAALFLAGVLLSGQSVAQTEPASAPVISAAEVAEPAAMPATEQPATAPAADLTAAAAQQLVPTHAGMDLSPLGMYQAADWVVKSVMILLLVASLLTWAIGVAKQLQIYSACRRGRRILRALLAADSLADGGENMHAAQGVGLALIHATRHELELSARGPASEAGIKER